MSNPILPASWRCAIAAALFLSAWSRAVHAQAAQADELPLVRGLAAVQPDLSERRTALRQIQVMGAQELEKYAYTSLGELLKTLPGISYSGPPGQIKDVRMRGLDKGYTEILINGEPVLGGTKELQLQTDRIPLDLVERIELLRAPVAGETGGGIGGTINAVLKQSVNDINAAQMTWLRSGSQNGHQLSFALGRTGELLDWQLAGSTLQRGEPKTKLGDEIKIKPDGRFESRIGSFEDELARITEHGFSPRLLFKLPAGQRLSLDGFNSQADERKDKNKQNFTAGTEQLTAERPGSREEEREDKRRRLQRLGLEWSGRTEALAAGEWRLKASQQRASEDKPKTRWSFNDKGALQSLGREQTNIDEQRDALSGRWLSASGAQHQVELGLAWSQTERSAAKTSSEQPTGKPEQIKPAGRGDQYELRENRHSLWLADQWKLNQFHRLGAGLRAEQVRTEGRDGYGKLISASRRALNPNVHHAWQLASAWQLRSSLAVTTRHPKLDDLSPVVQSDLGTELRPDKGGNPALKPERAWGLDVGLDHVLDEGLGVVGLNAFTKRIGDMVQRQVQSEGNRWVERPLNLDGSSQVRGLELDWNLSLRELGLANWRLRGNYSRFSSRVTDPKTGISGRAKDQLPWVANLGVDWKPSHALAAGFNLNMQSARPKSVLSENAESQQRLLDAFVSWQFQRHSFLRLTSNNLLNTDKHKVNGLKRELEQGVRAYSVSLELAY